MAKKKKPISVVEQIRQLHIAATSMEFAVDDLVSVFLKDGKRNLVADYVSHRRNMGALRCALARLSEHITLGDYWDGLT